MNDLNAGLPNPALDEMVKQAAERSASLTPVDRALHDAEQRRSWVRGMCGHDPGPDLLVEEVKRLRKDNANLTRLLSEALKREQALEGKLPRIDI